MVEDTGISRYYPFRFRTPDVRKNPDAARRRGQLVHISNSNSNRRADNAR